MDRKDHLSVTQLVAACTLDGWLDAFARGENPPVPFQGGDGIAVYGSKIHSLAEAFIDWAVHEQNWGKSGGLAGADEIFGRMQDLGAFTFTQELLQQGKIEACMRFTENLHRLSQHFAGQRSARSGAGNWAEIYLGQEYSLNDWLEVDGQPAVHVSGVIDSLRLRLDGGVEVVDYKFTTGTNPEKELVQLSIYQQLLAQVRRELSISGCLEYLWPEIHSCSASADELKAVFRIHVLPILRQLLPPPAPHNPPAAFRKAGRAAHSRIDLGIDANGAWCTLPTECLTRHLAALGGTGSGKTTAALNIIEQLLDLGIPAVLLDRKGDLGRYADPAAWLDPISEGPAAACRARLRGNLKIDFFTPGASRGRNLRLPIVPSGLSELSTELLDEACRSSAATLGSLVGLGRPSDKPRLAILTCALRLLARRNGPREVQLADLIALTSSDDSELREEMGTIETRHARSLAQLLQSLSIMQGHLLDPTAEPFDCESLFRPETRPRLTIINTKFLGDEAATLYWTAQLFLEFLRHVSRSPSPTLQGVLMIDEADLYLPATRSPATKGPLESLLKRARSGGLGLMICTQSPGDLDYKGRENIRTWLLGLIKETRALEKLRPLLHESGVPERDLAAQTVGKFILAAEGTAQSFQSSRNFMETRQLAEDDILRLARASKM